MKKDIFVGIDNGRYGAAVIIGEDRKVAYYSLNDDMFRCLISINADNYNNVYCGIEKSQTFPKMGIVSAFKFGELYGTAIGIIMAKNFIRLDVPPKAWQKEMCLGVVTDLPTKERAFIAAQRLFPDVKIPAKNGSFREHIHQSAAHDGFVDALLIAEYIRLKYKRI